MDGEGRRVQLAAVEGYGVLTDNTSSIVRTLKIILLYLGIGRAEVDFIG